MDWEEWKPHWDGKNLKETSLPAIELERQEVKLDYVALQKRIGEAMNSATL